MFLGSTLEDIEILEERRVRHGLSDVVFLGANLESAEPIVSRLAGS